MLSGVPLPISRWHAERHFPTPPAAPPRLRHRVPIAAGFSSGRNVRRSPLGPSQGLFGYRSPSNKSLSQARCGDSHDRLPSSRRGLRHGDAAVYSPPPSPASPGPADRSQAGASPRHRYPPGKNSCRTRPNVPPPHGAPHPPSFSGVPANAIVGRLPRPSLDLRLLRRSPSKSREEPPMLWQGKATRGPPPPGLLRQLGQYHSKSPGCLRPNVEIRRGILLAVEN